MTTTRRLARLHAVPRLSLYKNPRASRIALVGDTWWIPKRSIRKVAAEEEKECKRGRYLFKATAKWCETCLNLNVREDRRKG